MLFTITPLPAYAEEETNVVSATEEVGGGNSSGGENAADGESPSGSEIASGSEEISGAESASSSESASAGAGASGGEDASAGANTPGSESESNGEDSSSDDNKTIDIPIECIDVDVPLPEEEAEIIVEIREQIRIKMLPGEDSVAPESYMERNLAVIDGMIRIPELPADVLSSPEGDELFEYHFVNWATDTGELMNAGDWCVCGFDELTLTARWEKVVRKDILPEIKEQESFDGKTVTMGVELPAMNQYFLTATAWQYSDNDRGNPDAATWIEIPEAVGNVYTRTVESGDVGREFRCILTARDVSLMSDILFETISLHTQENGALTSDAPAGDDVSSSEGFVAEDSASVGGTATLPEDDPSVVAVFASQPASPVQERITTHHNASVARRGQRGAD